MNIEFFSSIKFKILGSLFLVLGLSISISLYGMWTYERDELIDMTHQEAVRAGLAIKTGLRHAMLENDKVRIEETIRETARVTMLSKISVLNNGGVVAISSEPSLVGHQLLRNNDATCTVCHVTPDIRPEKSIAVIAIDNEPILRNVIKIVNEPACHECHPPSDKTLGVLVFDSTLNDIYGLLGTTARRMIYTGAVTFLVIIVILTLIITRYITTPIQALSQGFRQVGDGDYEAWVEIDNSLEFNELASSFNVMSQAIKRYVDEVQDKGREINTLYTIVQRMSKSIDLSKVKEVVVSLISEVLETSNVVLVVPVDSRNQQFEVCGKKEGDRRFCSKEYTLDSDASPHEAVAREDLDNWLQGRQKAPVFRDNDCTAYIPLFQDEKHLGLICAVRRQDQKFTRADKDFIPALTHHISIAFTNARLYNMATTDALTGMYTKRFLITKLEEIFEAYHRNPEEPFFFLMLDLDHFKEVNDTYGHPVGDQVLSQIAKLVRQNVRRIDIPCRYGGEEFAVMLAGGDLTSAQTIAERIRQGIEAHTFDIEGFPAFQKTISIGLSGCPQNGTTSEAVLKAADDALYRAKNGGRNQVCVAGADSPAVAEAPESG